MSEPIISVSGLRGVVGESLTPEVAMRFVAAFAMEAPEGPIVLTRDGRTTGTMLAACVTGALEAMGRTVINAGVAATPTTGVLVRELKAAGGIQISASHNPPPYNGLKLFSAAGRVIPATEGEKVIGRYRAGDFAWRPHNQIGHVERVEDSTTAHWRLLSQIADIERIRAAKFKVVVDANHGAGSLLAQGLLAELGCQMTILGDTPDGYFAHPPEPTAENLQSVLKSVAGAGANIGFCQDPDADRLAIIDERGRYIGEEYTLAICVNHVLRRHRGPIVTNCSTSRMSEDIARRHGVPFYRSAVGEANVVDLMLRHSAVLGGEGNGGVINPRVVLVRDSFVGMTLVLEAMAERDLTVSQLVDELPRYEIYKAKITLEPDQLQRGLTAIEKHFSGATADRLDGLRIDWPNGRWLLARPSNTEPIVRIFAEAETHEAAKRLCDEAEAAIQKS